MPRPDLMETGEATAVVGAILWLAQTILETLQPGKLADWLDQVGLTGAIGELTSEVERMETVVNGVNGRAVGNKPLARSLARVKQLMYDADDVVDELDYCRLQQQVQGVMTAPAIELEGMVGDGAGHVDANTDVMHAPASEPEGMNGDRNRDGAEQACASANNVGMQNSSGRKNRSKAWDHFRTRHRDPTKADCIYCAAPITVGNGTSGMHKHLKSCEKKRLANEETPNRPSVGTSVQNGTTVSTNDSEGRKRMRIEYSVATTTHLWDKAEFLKRIQKIALDLQIIRGDVIEYLKDSIAWSGHYQSNNSDTRVRTSSSSRGKVYGREVEKYKILSAIKAAKSYNITVLPIVGILGVGKTALAKLVYHDGHVDRKFERIWIWVSNIFDEVRVTREILDVVTPASHEGSCKRESYEGVSNFSKLLEVLKKHMACLSKKFLLVLDDVYDCMDNSRWKDWKDLIDALGSSCRKGNVIIVTVRNLAVAKRLGTIEPVELRALGNDDFWLLFKACAFGDNNYKEHLDIGRQIAAKLYGNPLAAESAADMLREQPTLHHWKSIMKNGVWESLQFRGGIVTALKISYYHLPYNLQQCLLFCSIFPNGYLFHIDNLVDMWISSGFLKSVEVGQDYLNALVNSGIFEHVPYHEKCYVMCGIMHEFARLVSRAEFATTDGLDFKEVLPTVSHLSILYHEDECGIILYNGKFEEKLKSIISSVRRLRTLILIGHYDSLFFQSLHTFMCSLVNCTHLRYLKLENKGKSESLPISLNKFYHLEILDARCHAIVCDMNDLISMRHLVLTNGACSAFSPAMSASLQTIHLEDCSGRQKIPSLLSLSSLTKLKLRNMPEVTELLIPSLEELVLIDMPKLETCFSNSVRDLNSSLKVLEIKRCWVLKAFLLFESCENFEIEQKSWLPSVNEMTIHECPQLMVSNTLPPSSRFCKLSIKDVSTMPTMEGSTNGEFNVGSWNHFMDCEVLSFRNLRTITRLEIINSSISLEGHRQLVCLKRLELYDCTNSNVQLVHTQEDMPAIDFGAFLSLECLIIVDCEITGQWLSAMLQHVRGLKELCLASCEQITGLIIEGKENSLSNLTWAPRASSEGNLDSTWTRSCPDELLHVPSNLVSSLKKMSIEYCELKLHGNKEGFSVFTSHEELRIVRCPDLISSLVHEDETDDQAKGRWLLPYSLGVLDIRGSSLGTLQPCFPRDLTSFKVLEVVDCLELKSIQLYSCTALEKLTIGDCKSLDALEGFQCLHSLLCFKAYGNHGLKSLQLHSCTTLEKLTIGDCKSLDALEGFQCLHSLVCFEAYGNHGLKSLQLHSCTALEKLKIRDCKSLDALEGLQSLCNLTYLKVYKCPVLSQCLESLSTQCYELCPRLERLWIDDPFFLTTPFCKDLTSLQCLQLEGKYGYIDAAGLTCEQEAALQLLTSLQQLRFHYWPKLLDLPVGLHSLLSIKQMEIFNCQSISRLPERGLPPSLEELNVRYCSKELTEQCRKLATSKLKVIIDDEYVN